MGDKILGYVEQNDGYDYLRSQFLGREVQIYPGDTYSKFGIIRDINPAGLTFEITSSQAPQYKLGSLYFISFSSGLNYCLKKDD